MDRVQQATDSLYMTDTPSITVEILLEVYHVRVQPHTVNIITTLSLYSFIDPTPHYAVQCPRLQSQNMHIIQSL